jgi:organic radical activating enzyme
MRSPFEMDTIQIEVTTACRNRCSNCSRFVGYKEPWFMDLDFFKQAVDSLEGYPQMVGMQGGDPLLHPQFREMCEYLRSKFTPDHLGLWTTLPNGFEHYADDICSTFKHVFFNDHTRPDIFHAPSLVGIEEMVPNKNQMWHLIDNCWVQMSWSASINPRGAWFCEIAASMAMLFEDEDRKGWPIEKGWWHRLPADFREQMDMFCTRCGYPIKLKRRSSVEEIDDISPLNYERCKDFTKIKNGKYQLHDLQFACDKDLEQTPMAMYKDTEYRNTIAKRYNMFLVVNDQHFWSPYLIDAPTKFMGKLEWAFPFEMFGVSPTEKEMEVIYLDDANQPPFVVVSKEAGNENNTVDTNTPEHLEGKGC